MGFQPVHTALRVKRSSMRSLRTPTHYARAGSPCHAGASRGLPSYALSDDLLDRLCPFDADQLLIEPAVEVGQAVRVDAELVERGGVEVLDLEAVGHRCGAEFVGLADGGAALD